MTPPKTKNGVPAFDQIKPAHFLPAIDWAVDKARRNLDAIKAQQKPTFENTIAALETASADLDRIRATFENIEAVARDKDLDAISEQVSDRLSAFDSDVMLDADLFDRIKQVHDARATLKLDDDQKLLLEDTYNEFVRNGAELSVSDKKTLRDTDAELARLSKQFGRNALKSQNRFKLRVDNKSRLKGIPKRVIDAAAEEADKQGYKGEWVFTLDAPSYGPVMDYAEDRALREDMWRAATSVATQGKYNNRPVVKRILTLRHERAQLLGYSDHADYVLKDRMSGSKTAAIRLLRYLRQKSEAAAKQENADLQSFATANGGPAKLKPWDKSFWANRQYQADYGFDDEALRPYFDFSKVARGAFETAERLYGLDISKSSGYPVYDKDVETFEVKDKASGELIGILYTDYFPRDDKETGAWETAYRRAALQNGQRTAPVVGVHGNFDRPGQNTPSLLSYDDVQTFFHEFGHSLHDLLSQARYESQSGTNVKWDFVELPSQIMENWAREPEVLKRFAKHHETGKTIPGSLLKKMDKARHFRVANSMMRQLEFATLDLALHSTDPAKITSLPAFEERITQAFQNRSLEQGECLTASFSHIMNGGYDAGYNSYKWAEVLDADAFERFKDEGLFNAQTAREFRKLLEAGGSRDPMELFTEFTGHAPDPDALLRRDGLMPPKPANVNAPKDDKDTKNKPKPRKMGLTP